MPDNVYRLSNPFSRIVGFSFGGYVLIISENTSNYNVYDAFVAKYGTPPESVNLTVIIEPGVVVTSSSSVLPAMKLRAGGQNWPGEPTVTLINRGHILGKGGDGGFGATFYGGPITGADGGGSGGNALQVHPITVSIDNAAGEIFGGGGGGGGGGNGAANDGGGGGGGGAESGAGGAGGSPLGPTPGADGMNATSGISATPGSGGLGSGSAGNGGNGGDWGADGSPGTGAINFGIGGGAGRAVDLIAGSVIWLSGNTPERVKGAVA